MSREQERETITVTLPGDVVDRSREIAELTGLSVDDVVTWCLVQGFVAYDAGKKPTGSGTLFLPIPGGNGSS